jgi:methionyl-tRNA formyltransferase
MGVFNIHYSILPDLRGPDPVRWALLKGYEETGVTLMKIDEKIDTGAMIDIKKINIDRSDNYETLKEKLTDEGLKLIDKLMNDISAGNEIRLEQQQTKDSISYASKLDKNYCKFDWARSPGEIINRIRAFSPYPGCKITYEKKNLVIKLVEAEPGLVAGGEAGTLAEIDKNSFTLYVNNGSIKILKLQPTGKRIMTAGEFMAGNPLEQGILLNREIYLNE